MSKLRSITWLVVVTIFAVALVILALSHMVTDPAHVIPELGGDAIKNTFTYVYHSVFGKGYWFEGMNYPYGEHIVYTDGQPVISVLLAHMDGITPEKALAVFWLLLGASYVLSIIYVYKILVHFKVHPFWAMIFAGLICIFTPQILRLKGHYALAYTCIVPMLFYWTIRYHEKGHWRYCLYFFITGCIAAFIHPYYVALMLMWVVFYLVGYFIFVKAELLHKVKHAIWLFSSVVLVLGTVGVVMKLTDPVKDRPVTPFNTLYDTCTRLKQLVTSTHSPVWERFKDSDKYYMVSDGGEGYAYLGVVVTLIISICLVVMVVKSIKQKKLSIVGSKSGFDGIWLFLALCTLLLGMGVPFIWGMDGLMQHLSVFKQFRSLGRFSWLFYYIITIYAVVVIYHFCSGLAGKKKFLVGYPILLLSAGLWSYEVSGYVKYAHDLADKGVYYYGVVYTPEEQGWEHFLREHKYKGSDFQAILSIPFFHVGTEKLWVGDPDWKIMLSSKAALQLHLPIVDVMMSRSSWSQAMGQVRIDGGPFTDKPILRDIKTGKPFLLLHFEEDSLNIDQRYLLQGAEYLGHISQCHVYACYPLTIAANDKQYKDSVMAILPFMKHADTVINGNDSTTCYFNHFDENTTGPHLFGGGGVGAVDRDSAILATIPVKTPKDKELYEFACWFLLGKEDYRSPYITLQMLDVNGAIVKEYDALSTKSVDNNGMWVRASRYFWMYNNVSAVRFKLVNIPRPTYIAMDELLLRPANTLVISKSADGSIMANNHLIKQNNSAHDK